MNESPEQRFAEAIVESPLYGHLVQSMADAAWGESKSHLGRCAKLGEKLKAWMLERNPFPDDGPPLEILFFKLAAERFGWSEVAEVVAEELGMPARKYPIPSPRPRRGFTLVEMLASIAILSVILVAAGAAAVYTTADMRRTSGADILATTLITARSQALAKGSSGVRLVPDRAESLVRLADGTLDVTQALTYSRIMPLVQPAPYRTGMAAIHADGFPAAFVPLPGRLVLEEAIYDSAGLRCEPTNWYGNVRVGDSIEVMGRIYVVTGPMVLGPGDGNAERYVNIGPEGTPSPIVRYRHPKTGKDMPSEYLYLVDRIDDDSDGVVDEGFNGFDDDLDGYIDEDDEWEAEAWHGTPRGGVAAAPYILTRRLSPTDVDSATLPESVVVDATGWATDKLRSRVPVDPFTGAIDLTFDARGVVDTPSIYGGVAPKPISSGFVEFWVADVGDAVSPPVAKGSAKLVTLDLRTGQATAGYADATDVDGTFATAEGRGK